jgi:hypothetical protein
MPLRLPIRSLALVFTCLACAMGCDMRRASPTAPEELSFTAQEQNGALRMGVEIIPGRRPRTLTIGRQSVDDFLSLEAISPDSGSTVPAGGNPVTVYPVTVFVHFIAYESPGTMIILQPAFFNGDHGVNGGYSKAFPIRITERGQTGTASTSCGLLNPADADRIRLQFVNAASGQSFEPEIWIPYVVHFR